jgi:Sulfotransferase domain
MFMPCYYYSASRHSSRYTGVVRPSPEYDYRSIAKSVEELPKKEILFLKEIAFHMEGIIHRDFLIDFAHSFMIRNPRKSIPSLFKLMPDMTFEETGFCGIKKMFDFVRHELGQLPVVVNGTIFQSSPAMVLKEYCERMGIRFKDTTTWETGKLLPEWQRWPEWHERAMSASGIAPPDRDIEIELPEHIRDMIVEATPIYEELNAFAIGNERRIP